jgi:hypothetical protein
LINEENTEFVPIKKFSKKNKNMPRGTGHVLEHVFELKIFLKNLNVQNSIYLFWQKTIMEILRYYK